MIRDEADPLPGDFDEELGELDTVDVQVVDASGGRSIVVQIELDEDDAAALRRITHNQGGKPGEVVRSLIREASRRAA